MNKIISSHLEEDMMVTIQNDNEEEFITLIKNFHDWENYLLQEEEQKFIHYAISNKIIYNYLIIVII